MECVCLNCHSYSATRVKEWHKKQDKDTRAEGDEMKKLVNDATFQRMSSEIVEFMKPAYNMPRSLDNKVPNLSNKVVPVPMQAQAEMEATDFSS